MQDPRKAPEGDTEHTQVPTGQHTLGHRSQMHRTPRRTFSQPARKIQARTRKGDRRNVAKLCLQSLVDEKWGSVESNFIG